MTWQFFYELCIFKYELICEPIFMIAFQINPPPPSTVDLTDSSVLFFL